MFKPYNCTLIAYSILSLTACTIPDSLPTSTDSAKAPVATAPVTVNYTLTATFDPVNQANNVFPSITLDKDTRVSFPHSLWAIANAYGSTYVRLTIGNAACSYRNYSTSEYTLLPGHCNIVEPTPAQTLRSGDILNLTIEGTPSQYTKLYVDIPASAL